MADSVSQSIRYVKEMELSGCYRNIDDVKDKGISAAKSLKQIKDGISIGMKKHLSDTF
jgi:hypothetical protein